MRRKPIPKKLLHRLYYRERLSMRAIAQRLGNVSDFHVWREMQRHGLVLRPQSTDAAHAKSRKPLPKGQLARMCAKALTLKQMAEQLEGGPCGTHIRDEIRRYGIRRKSTPVTSRKLPADRELIRLYTRGTPLSEIARAFGVRPNSVWVALKRAGILPRHDGKVRTRQQEASR